MELVFGFDVLARVLRQPMLTWVGALRITNLRSRLITPASYPSLLTSAFNSQLLPRHLQSVSRVHLRSFFSMAWATRS